MKLQSYDRLQKGAIGFAVFALFMGLGVDARAVVLSPGGTAALDADPTPGGSGTQLGHVTSTGSTGPVTVGTTTINNISLTVESYAYLVAPTTVDFFYKLTLIPSNEVGTVVLDKFTIDGWSGLGLSAYKNAMTPVTLKASPVTASLSADGDSVAFDFIPDLTLSQSPTNWFEIEATGLSAAFIESLGEDVFKKTLPANTNAYLGTITVNALGASFDVAATPTPEPSTAMFGLALIGCVCASRRRQMMA